MQKVTRTGFVIRAVPRPAPAGKEPSITEVPGAPKLPSPEPGLTGLPTQLSLFEPEK